MKRWLIVLIVILVTSLFAGEAKKPTLILNSLNRATVLPQHFRLCTDALHSCTGKMPSTEGLSKLNISGSGQFSLQALAQIRKLICLPNLIVVDLRQESHGFINGIPVSWFVAKNWINKGKTLNEIIADEKRRLNELLVLKEITLYEIGAKNPEDGSIVEHAFTISMTLKDAVEEEQICQQLKVRYFRLPVTDHLRPTDADVDQFLNFIQSLPTDRWIHFHCLAGIGRTTTFMAMYDIYHNSTNVSFEDILARQSMLVGSIDLLKVPLQQKWINIYKKERLDFLKQFYTYCKQNSNHRITWTAYLKAQS